MLPVRPAAALVVLSALASLASLASRPAGAQGASGDRPAATARATAADREAVRRALLDYVEGFYEGDSTKHVRSVWPEVRKWGYARAGAEGAYRGMAMPYAQFLAFDASIREGRRRTPPDAPKVVEVYDVQDQTASGKVTAYWGIDYVLLAREHGRWMITHVLWQTTK